MARARSSGTKDAWMMASDPGVSRAPPTPCSARAAMRAPMLGAAPQARLARANQITPIVKIRLRPKRSPRDPPSRISEASVSR